MNKQNIDTNIVAILDKIADIRRSVLWKISEQYSLTPLQIQILQFIKMCGVNKNISPMHIAKELYISKATASNAITALLQKGMLSKIPNEDDSRSYHLTLTKKAHDILQKIEGTRNDIAGFFSKISYDNKMVAYSVLTQLVMAMQDEGFIDYVAICINCQNCKQLSQTTFQCTVTQRTFEYDGIHVGCCNFADKRVV